MPKRTKAGRKNLSLNLLTYVFACVLLGLSISNLRLYFDNKNIPQVLGEESNKLTEEKSFWQEFVLENPTYQDGWIMLVKINLSLGNLEDARTAFEKAKEINPNSEEISKLNNSF